MRCNGGGRVKCWGLSSAGQLGNDSTSNSATPVDVARLTGVTSIAVGAEHTCATVAGGGNRHSCAIVAGRAMCWGYNFYGQVTNGGKTNAIVPEFVQE